jgi:hypothetical protein
MQSWSRPTLEVEVEVVRCLAHDQRFIDSDNSRATREQVTEYEARPERS